MNRAQKHMLAVKELGCIVCRNAGYGNVPADVHHLLEAGRRIDDFHVIPLCQRHHRAGLNNTFDVSRHPWRKEFERRYGTELELLEQTRKLLERAA